METEIYKSYEFGVGSLKKIRLGNVKKFDSLDNLEIPEQQGVIILPKIIGVYQKENRFEENLLWKKTIDSIGNQEIFRIRW